MILSKEGKYSSVEEIIPILGGKDVRHRDRKWLNAPY